MREGEGREMGEEIGGRNPEDEHSYGGAVWSKGR